MSWEVEPVTGGAVLEPGTDTTDGDGKATARLIAGTERETYTVRATVDGAGGRTDVVELAIEVIPKVTIRYLWRQTIEQWDEEGSTRWPDPTSLQPDCFLANLNYCIDDFHISLAPNTSPDLQRAGTLTGAGTSVVLDEAVFGAGTASRATWRLTRPDGTDLETGSKTVEWTVTDPEAYSGHDLEKVKIVDEPDGIHLEGLQEVGNLPYHYALRLTGFTGVRDPSEVHAAQTPFFLVPQGEGTPLNFGAHPDAELFFGRTDEGFDAYQSCGAFEHEFELPRGYLVQGQDDEFFSGSGVIKSKPDYVAGDRPLPVGEGSFKIRYAFAATIAYDGDAPAEPELPACEDNHPPEAGVPLDAGRGRRGPRRPLLRPDEGPRPGRRELGVADERRPDGDGPEAALHLQGRRRREGHADRHGQLRRDRHGRARVDGRQPAARGLDRRLGGAAGNHGDRRLPRPRPGLRRQPASARADHVDEPAVGRDRPHREGRRPPDGAHRARRSASTR